MKKKLVIILTSLVTMSTAVLCVLTAKHKESTSLVSEAAATTRTLTIDMTKYSTNASGSTSVKTTLGNKIWIQYNGRTAVYNTTKITNLQSVQIYFTASSMDAYAYVEFGSSQNPSGVEICRSSGTTVKNDNTSSYKYFKVGQATYESISC